MTAVLLAASEGGWDRNGPAVVTLSAAIVGALAAAGGGYFARTREWKRERRHAAYAEFVEAHRAFMLQMTVLVATKREPAAVGSQAEFGKDLHTIGDRFWTAYALVALLARNKVLKAADDIQVLTTRLYVQDFLSIIRKSPVPMSPPFPPNVDEINKAVTEFLVVAGAEVGSRRHKKTRRALLAGPNEPPPIHSQPVPPSAPEGAEAEPA